MSKFVTFGEIMMRLNPEGYNHFVQAERFEASYAGVGGNLTNKEWIASGAWDKIAAVAHELVTHSRI